MNGDHRGLIQRLVEDRHYGVLNRACRGWCKLIFVMYLECWQDMIRAKY